MSMKLSRPRYHLDVEWLWQFDDGEKDINVFDAPDSTYFTFGIFVLDKLAVSIEEQLKSVLESTHKTIDSWNASYPWSEYSPIILNQETLDDGKPYIFGHLCVEDNVREEEFVVISLLRQISLKAGPETFIHVSDIDGDVILAECYDVLPEDFEYPIANNRLWLHEGKFKLIPLTYYGSRGLRPQEALEYLEKSYFQCIEIEEITARVNKLLKGYPEKALSNLVKVPIELKDGKAYEAIKQNKQVTSYLIKHILKENIVWDKSTTTKNSQTHKLEVITQKDHANLLSIVLENQGLKQNAAGLPAICGSLMSKALMALLETSELKYESVELQNEASIEPIFSIDDLKVADLLHTPYIEGDMEPTTELMQKLGKLFKSVDATEQKTTDNTSKTDSDIEDSDESNLDSEARNYFEKNNIDIDEDDFFEFFLKEALKLKKEETELYRNKDTTSLQQEDLAHTREDADFEELDTFLKQDGDKNDPHEAIEYLLQSLSVDGAPGGPLQALLQQLADSK